MNLIWIAMIIISLIMLLFSDPSQAILTMTSSAENALTLSLSLCGIYCVWLGLLNIANDCGIVTIFSNLIKPLTVKLFGNQSTETYDYISLNLSANIIGVGNAATPAAIKAIKSMDDNTGNITKAMVMLFVINSSSIQLIPTTIISIRSSLGSISPSSILLPTLIVSTLNTLLGVLLVWLAYKKPHLRIK